MVSFSGIDTSCQNGKRPAGGQESTIFCILRGRLPYPKTRMLKQPRDVAPRRFLLCSLRFIAKLLIVVAAALVASGKWFLYVYTRILPFKLFDLSCHLSQHLIVFFTSRPGVKRRL